MTDERREAALALLREALAILDAAGENRVAPYLQYALDLLDRDGIALQPFWELPTCH